jgi:CPA1 family monovalent cation:H+ antiporter
VAYAIIGVFAAAFSLVSLFVKEKLYIGEATVAALIGLIVGPHCLNWFAPTEWGNSDYITLEISRIVLCLQIFAVAVELPKKYMMKHWVSVAMLLVPVMTWGWLIVGVFIFALFPKLNFAEGLTVAACVTATDPVLAAAVVGKGKFARRVPGHLRNVLSAESGCNDGMAFPFIYLGINLVIHAGKGGEIVKDWILVTLLYECIFGVVLGVVIGYCGRHAIKYAEKKGLIDRESFLAFYVVLALACAGFGSILGVDDLLVAFAAGAAFSWDGWFARKTEETHVSTVIDLLVNLAYFVYFGAIIPWAQFNSPELGLNVWRLVVLAIVVIFLRRIPAVLALKPLIPDIKTWREALFCGHFGPIGVGAVYAAIVARAALEGSHTRDATPTQSLPGPDDENYYLIAVIWPITTFLIITSIVVHGSSVAVITLGRTLNTMAISMSFTKTGDNSNTTSWMSRLPELKSNGRSFSLHRIDTTSVPLSSSEGKLSQANTIETTGILAKPAGGMERRKNKKHKHKRRGLNRIKSYHNDEPEITSEQLQREKEANAAAFALGRGPANVNTPVGESSETPPVERRPTTVGVTPSSTFVGENIPFPSSTSENGSSDYEQAPVSEKYGEDYEENRKPSNAYAEGNTLIIEDQHGEILESAKMFGLEGNSSSLAAVKSNQSSVSSILSPRRTLERVRSGDTPKYTAYKVGDQLVIESKDGEVLRRYKINHHAHHGRNEGEAKPRSRSSTLSKALIAVGLKGSEPKATVERIPIKPLSLPIHEDANEDDDDNDYDDETTDDDDDSLSIQSDEDVGNVAGNGVQETAIERKRRLTALGQVAAPRDESDEEDTPTFQKPAPAH